MSHMEPEQESILPVGNAPQPSTATPSRVAGSQRRLVSKSVYVRTIGRKVRLFSLFGFQLCLGVLLTLGTLISLYFVLFPLVLALGILACVAFFYSGRSFTQAREIEPVLPITNRTSHLLPLEASLVRASAMPPTHQRKDLLRAARSNSETPTEELLRPKDANAP